MSSASVAERRLTAHYAVGVGGWCDRIHLTATAPTFGSGEMKHRRAFCGVTVWGIDAFPVNVFRNRRFICRRCDRITG